MRTQDRQFRGQVRRMEIELPATKSALITAQQVATENRRLAEDANRFAARASEGLARVRFDRNGQRYAVQIDVDAAVLRAAWYSGDTAAFVHAMADRMCHELVETWRRETMLAPTPRGT